MKKQREKAHLHDISSVFPSLLIFSATCIAALMFIHLSGACTSNYMKKTQLLLSHAGATANNRQMTAKQKRWCIATSEQKVNNLEKVGNNYRLPVVIPASRSTPGGTEAEHFFPVLKTMNV